MAKRLDDYKPVARALDFLVENFDAQPSLEEIAAYCGYSPAHFQRLFKAGAGVSPKRFLQYMAASKAKNAFANGATVEGATLDAGLSGSARLHDLFLVAEAMTPGTYKKKGAGLTIHYGTFQSPLGAALIGATRDGICWLSFADSAQSERGLAEMKQDWLAANFVEDAGAVTPFAEQAFAFLSRKPLDKPLGLFVQGTNFQLKVWEALLRIPYGDLVTYGDIAEEVCTRRASRAVGAAVGANMISLLIPCHRVILSSGIVHNYRWGAPRKSAILAMEAVVSSGEEAGVSV